MTDPTQRPDEAQERPVVRDRRRIDPLTGAVRDPEATSGPARPSVPDTEEAEGASVARDISADIREAEALAGELEAVRAKESALLDDLKRLQAEYVNYRRRVDRDRDVARDVAIAGVLEALLPVLDDIGRAREHGDLDGTFKAVAEALEATVGRLGLERYGEPGDPFDPAIHEALMHAHDDEVQAATCVQVLFPGYRFRDRILRAARVAVAEPS